MCPDTTCVIPESSLFVEVVNSITKWCKSILTKQVAKQVFHQQFQQAVSLKKPKTHPRPQ